MKYAVNVPIFDEYSDVRYLASLAVDAEQAGWDGFFIWDHMATSWGPAVADPWVALAAIALSTERVKIGPMVTPLSRRRPWKLARETVSLDRLSGGRLIMGVGLGTWHEELDYLGDVYEPKVRAAMLDEGLDVLTGLWSGEPFSFEGAHYHIQNARFTPTPVQEPRIPIWVAGTWPIKAPFRRAARWDGAFPMMLDEQGHPTPMTPEQVRDVATFIREQRTSDEPYDIILGGRTPGDDPSRGAEIVAEYEEAGLTWWHEGINPDRWGSWASPWPVEQMRERILQGPPR